MKKLILSLLSIFLFSCSSEETPSDKIIGSWQFYGVTEVTVAGEESETIANECSRKSTITFKSNGDFIERDYHNAWNSGGECVLNEATLNHKMMWEETGDGKYRIFSDGSQGTVYEMKFPNDNTLWMIPSRSNYERDGVTYDFTAYVHKRS